MGADRARGCAGRFASVGGAAGKSGVTGRDGDGWRRDDAWAGWLAGGGYLLLLRKRLSCLQIQLGVESDSRRPPAEEMSFSAGRDRYFRLAAEAGYGLEGWIDLTGRLYWVNQAIERYTGRSVEEVLAGDFFELTVYERDRSYSRDLLRQALETGVAAEFELRLVNERGNVQWMASHWQPIRSDDGTLLGLRVTMTDIQARKEAEFKLLESVAALRRAQALSEHYLRRSNEERSRLSALLDAIRLGILFMDSDRRVVYCNRALSEIWGCRTASGLSGCGTWCSRSRLSEWSWTVRHTSGTSPMC